MTPGKNKFDPMIHLAYGDVTVNSHQDPQYLEVKIKASKTDPFRQGVTIYLGKGSRSLCPVAVNLGYMVVRGSQPRPFFKYKDGKALTRDCFVQAVQVALSAMGLN